MFDKDLAEIEARDNALKKLEHDMNDINVIFKDLAVMIHDQGDTVNSIEANIETTQSRLQTANQSLQVAINNKVSFHFLDLVWEEILIIIEQNSMFRIKHETKKYYF